MLVKIVFPSFYGKGFNDPTAQNGKDSNERALYNSFYFDLNGIHCPPVEWHSGSGLHQIHAESFNCQTTGLSWFSSLKLALTITAEVEIALTDLIF